MRERERACFGTEVVKIIVGKCIARVYVFLLDDML
jgi:hypothetical protein